MNKDKLIPIDFSRNITPPVAGDTMWNDYLKVEFDLTESAASLLSDDGNDPALFVVSFADRPNTGKQPVGDDVVVDAWHESNCYTERAGDLTWLIDEGLPLAKWKPNHDAMLKQWQAEQLTEEAKRMDNIAMNGNDGDHYEEICVLKVGQKWTPNEAGSYFTMGKYYEIKSVGDDGFIIIEDDEPLVPHTCNGEWLAKNFTLLEKDQAHHIALQIEELGEVPEQFKTVGDDITESDLGAIGLSTKPTFTQAMADAGELPMVGVKCLVALGEGYVKEGCEVLAYFESKEAWVRLFDGNCTTTVKLLSDTFKPIQTPEETLRGHLWYAINQGADSSIDAIVNDLLASPEFTIKLNSE